MGNQRTILNNGVWELSVRERDGVDRYNIAIKTDEGVTGLWGLLREDIESLREFCGELTFHGEIYA